LRSPSGLEQGRFVVSRDSSGKAVAINGRGNLGLFANTETRLQQRGVKLPSAAARVVHAHAGSGAIDLADLKLAIRGMTGGAQ
jgi:hypothetical protein